MIDPISEELKSMAAAAALCPERRAGRPTHKSTLYRWSTVGCNGVRLETIQIGGTRCTSVQALRRFFGALTQKASPKLTHQPVLQIPEDEVSRRLAAEGFGTEIGIHEAADDLDQQGEFDGQ